MTIRGRFGLLTGVAVLAMTVMGFLSFWGARGIVLDQLIRSGEDGARFGQSTVENWMRGRIQLVTNTAINVAYLWDDYGTTEVILAGYMESITEANVEDGFVNVYTGFPNGRFADGTGWMPPSGYDPRTRPWYSLAVERGVPAFTSPFVDMVTGNTVVSVVCPSYSSYDGGLIGVVGADLDLAVLEEQVKGQSIGGVGQVYLIDQSGLAVIHPDKEVAMKKNLFDVDKALAPFREMILDRSQGGYVRFSREGEDCIAFYMPLFTGWHIVMTVSESLLLAPIKNLGLRALALGSALTILLLFFILLITRTVLIPLERLKLSSGQVAEGDLTVSVHSERKDEIAQVSNGIDRMISSLRSFFLSLDNRSRELENGASSLADTVKGNEELSEQLRKRVSVMTQDSISNSEAIEEVNGGMEEISAGTKETARASQEAAQGALSLKSEAQFAVEAISVAAHRIEEMASAFEDIAGSVSDLHENAGRIGDMVKSITAIADQTNLLALNAAIEAARAGDAGRGFAVVAEEVRKLAEESNIAAGEIGNLAEEIVRRTKGSLEAAEEGRDLAERGTEESQRMRSNMASVIRSVDLIGEQLRTIASASEQQSAGTQEMAESIERISSGVARTGSEVQGIEVDLEVLAEGADRLVSLAEVLNEISLEMRKELRRYVLDGDNSSPQHM
nr:methyl-accepting chemotaxis protein [uncultured Dethiosulfovibrio sp.]